MPCVHTLISSVVNVSCRYLSDIISQPLLYATLMKTVTGAKQTVIEPSPVQAEANNGPKMVIETSVYCLRIVVETKAGACCCESVYDSVFMARLLQI